MQFQSSELRRLQGQSTGTGCGAVQEGTSRGPYYRAVLLGGPDCGAQIAGPNLVGLGLGSVSGTAGHFRVPGEPFP
jgi:hypothetical protein